MKNQIKFARRAKDVYDVFVARDFDGELHMYSLPPKRGVYMRAWIIDDITRRLSIPNYHFPELEWEDEPVVVKEIR